MLVLFERKMRVRLWHIVTIMCIVIFPGSDFFDDGIKQDKSISFIGYLAEVENIFKYLLEACKQSLGEIMMNCSSLEIVFHGDELGL